MDKYPIILNSNTNIKSKKKYIRFDHELLLEIDRARGQEKSFSAWVKQACRNELIDKNRNGETVTTLHKKTYAPVRPAMDSLIDDEALALSSYWLEKGLFHQQIANKLNQLEMKTSSGHMWTRVAVRALLTS